MKSKDTRIVAYVTPKQAEDIRNEAAKKGTTVSKLVAEKLKGAILK
jgi:hypothetical protein